MKRNFKRIKERVKRFIKGDERGAGLIEIVVGVIIAAIGLYVLIVLFRYLIIPAIFGD